MSYTTQSVNDNIYICANGINDGKYAYNNLQQFDATWYHKFSKTVHMATESWYMYERDVPGARRQRFSPKLGANPAYCLTGRRALHRSRIRRRQFSAERTLRCTTSYRSAATFSTTRKASALATQQDIQRTQSCGATGSAPRCRLRPELRFERAWDQKAYDNGRDKNQFTVASDVIFHF